MQLPNCWFILQFSKFGFLDRWNKETIRHFSPFHVRPQQHIFIDRSRLLFLCTVALYFVFSFTSQSSAAGFLSIRSLCVRQRENTLNYTATHTQRLNCMCKHGHRVDVFVCWMWFFSGCQTVRIWWAQGQHKETSILSEFEWNNFGWWVEQKKTVQLNFTISLLRMASPPIVRVKIHCLLFHRTEKLKFFILLTIESVQ